MEKYYTPTIEEFKVGFNYEFIHSDYWEQGWIKYLTPVLNMELEDCPFGSSSLENYRVKYLDRQDIENFGFSFVGKTIDNWYELKGDFNKPLSNYKFQKISLRHDFRTHQGIHIVGYKYESGSGAEETLFLGFCKNKLKLKEILIKCGILVSPEN